MSTSLKRGARIPRSDPAKTRVRRPESVAPFAASPSDAALQLQRTIGNRRASEMLGDIRESARRGISDHGSPLPHLDAIQRSFGAHDVGDIQAHTGEAAARASGELGAHAYATGNHVAFADAPDLHTAAHEAAHVVQQRAGVHLPGGIGEAGDAYESHAEAVADAVVSGRSAKGLLSQLVSTRHSAAHTASAQIQRQAAEQETKPDTRVLSGAAWCEEYPTGKTIDDLADEAFRTNVQAFYDALIALKTTENKLDIDIDATQRPVERAHLMHYCYRVHNGTITPQAANTASEAAGININWDHGNLANSKAKAGEMVTTYKVAYAPALSSRHTQGKAIDWSITWSGTLKMPKKGETTELDCTGSGATSTDLHKIGASYGVHKLVGDAPHWSSDGS